MDFNLYKKQRQEQYKNSWFVQICLLRNTFLLPVIQIDVKLL